jgi:hypothetical protein
MVERLRAEIVRNPNTIIRHAGLFQIPLHDQPADPVIVTLLSSPDADIRYSAAYALVSCKDATLAAPIVALAKEESKRTQALALQMAEKLPDDAFKLIRQDLIRALVSTDPAVKRAAIRAFATHKDMAIAVILREYMTTPTLPAEDELTMTRSLQALTGSTFGFNLRAGPERNAPAIQKFDQWVIDHGGTPANVQALP